MGCNIFWLSFGWDGEDTKEFPPQNRSELQGLDKSVPSINSPMGKMNGGPAIACQCRQAADGGKEDNLILKPFQDISGFFSLSNAVGS